jgi:hypothetical protein
MIIKPPGNIALREKNKTVVSVFLAGSIEMGSAVDWQSDLGECFSKKGFVVFNPRRDDWDSSWQQKFESPQFYQQVNWELNALDQADYIIMYFDPNTKSPISLLELGLYATSKKLWVICPDGFWRKGNVDMVCNKYNIPLFTSIEDFKKFGPIQLIMNKA